MNTITQPVAVVHTTANMREWGNRCERWMALGLAIHYKWVTIQQAATHWCRFSVVRDKITPMTT